MEQGARYFYMSLSEKKKNSDCFRQEAGRALPEQTSKCSQTCCVCLGVGKHFGTIQCAPQGFTWETKRRLDSFLTSPQKKGGKKIEKNVNLVEVSLTGT